MRKKRITKKKKKITKKERKKERTRWLRKKTEKDEKKKNKKYERREVYNIVIRGYGREVFKKIIRGDEESRQGKRGYKRRRYFTG